MNRALLLVAVTLVAGCFDSLVNGPCSSGYQMVQGECVERTAPDGGGSDARDGGDAGDAGLDGTTVDGSTVDASTDASLADASTIDAGPTIDAFVCSAPLLQCDGACIDASSDPDNCGACNRVCASGICQLGHCVGELSGHIVAIGHDYQAHHAAMARVLGNAIALGASPDVGVARLRGTATGVAHAGTTSAITSSLAAIGRPFHTVTLPAPALSALDGVDVLIVEAQTGDGPTARASGASWATPIDRFLQRGGVVVVLEGAGDVSYEFADGAALYTVATPVPATNLPAQVVDANDSLTQQVLTPYLAETTSVAFTDVTTATISTTNGTLVFHRTRY